MANDELHRERERRGADIIAELEAHPAAACTRCGVALCTHEAVMSMALGLLGGAECTACLASGMQLTPPELVDHAYAFIGTRECWSMAWRYASARESSGGTHPPACLARRTAATAPPAPSASTLTHASWDAGDLACGELLVELRQRMRALAPGATLALISRDPASPEDLPAWCQLAGHELLSAAHPAYLIRRRQAPAATR